MIFIYAVEAYNRSPEFWGEVLAAVYNRTGVNAIYMADTLSPSYILAFDGLYTYNPILIADLNSTYSDMARVARSFGKIWAATATPGYDDRKVRYPGIFVDREGVAYYERVWRAAIASNPSMILITTFNEWHEGTEIEPSREYGFRYMELTKAYVELFKKTPIERPPTPAIGLELQVREGGAAVEIGNLGAGDAIAVNLVIEATNASLGISSNPVGLPTGRVYIYIEGANSSSAKLLIPMLEPGWRIGLLSIVPYGGASRSTLALTYYSLDGRELAAQRDVVFAIHTVTMIRVVPVETTVTRFLTTTVTATRSLVSTVAVEKIVTEMITRATTATATYIERATNVATEVLTVERVIEKIITAPATITAEKFGSTAAIDFGIVIAIAIAAITVASLALMLRRKR